MEEETKIGEQGDGKIWCTDKHERSMTRGKRGGWELGVLLSVYIMLLCPDLVSLYCASGKHTLS